MKKKYRKVIDFYMSTNAEQKAYLLELMSDKITIPVSSEEGVRVLHLDEEVPVIMNGIYFQLNTEDWRILKKNKNDKNNKRGLSSSDEANEDELLRFGSS